MNLFSGRYADLKDTFIDFIKTLKQNPLDKVLIVLPSQRLAADLKKGLAHNLGCVSALYFTDFTHLADNINMRAAGDYKPLQKASPLQNFIIKNILEDYGQTASRGYCAALKAAFLDLSGALAAPEDLLNLAQESETLTEEQKNDLKTLAVFYEKYLKRIQNDTSYTYAQMFLRAAQEAAQSNYLKEFKHIIFYGSYDFTGLQLELFNAVRESCPVTVFFPYEPNPACNFAKKVYEGYMLGKAAQSQKIPTPQTPINTFCQNIFKADGQEVTDADIKIISVSGTAAEVQSAAKEILRLKEEQNIDFEDIALTARTFEPYRGDILNILEQNKIPVNATLETPLLQDPFAAFIFNLFNLEKNNFYRDDVCAVITSPYFKEREDIWPSLVKGIGVSAGFQQWADLLPLAKEQDPAARLQAFLNKIKNSLEQLNAVGNFEELSQLAGDIINTYADTQEAQKSAEPALQTILKFLEQLAQFKTVRPMAKRGEFLEEFTALIKEATLNKVSPAQRGVTAADIMALRGQTFKAVIIMGLNEGLLPAQPAHDPVLKDEYRSLMQTLGYPLHKRADRYDEEKLLFYFALSAARQSATFIYQRSGEDGKPKIPSLYLTQALRVMGQDLNKNNSFVLSRRPAESYAQWPAVYLNKTEAQLLTCLSSAKNKPLLLAQTDENAKEFNLQNIAASAALNAQANLTDFDGFIGAGNSIAAELEVRGISPSDLQNLYKCPARYLFDKITLKEEDIPFERGALSPLKKGTLYHKILENFYSYAAQNNLFDKLFAQGAKDILKQFTDEHLNKQNYRQYGMYPVVWDMTAREMEEFLSNLVAKDLENIQQSGLYPALFELRRDAEVSFENQAVKLRGTLDRIDISKDGKSYAITDYKTKKESASMEKAIFTKSVLQPPLYFEMAKTLPELKDYSPQSMTLLGIEAQGNTAKTLAYDEYLALRPRVSAMLAFILNLLKQGIFIINPCEESCKNCRFESACRKAHTATDRRCKNTKEAKKLREYHAA